ncbi:hypothetical protein GCM10009736_70170 [Actinomadura bangladeshensis]
MEEVREDLGFVAHGALGVVGGGHHPVRVGCDNSLTRLSGPTWKRQDDSCPAHPIRATGSRFLLPFLHLDGLDKLSNPGKVRFPDGVVSRAGTGPSGREPSRPDGAPAADPRADPASRTGRDAS